MTGYHDHPAMSSTKLKTALTMTGRGYWARHIDPDRDPFQPTEAMRQGSLVDLLITQPDLFAQRYLVATADGRTKEGKEIKARAAAAGLELIPAIWLENAQRIRDVLMADPEIGAILADALVTGQEPHIWSDEQGRQCRYMPDIETQACGLWDLKKARSAAPRATAVQSYQLAYDIQLAHYAAGYSDRHGSRPAVVGIIAYEWEWPHDCALLTATEAFLAMGHERREQAFQRIADWEAAGLWPSHGSQPLDVPPWRQEGSAQPEPESIELF